MSNEETKYLEKCEWINGDLMLCQKASKSNDLDPIEFNIDTRNEVVISYPCKLETNHLHKSTNESYVKIHGYGLRVDSNKNGIQIMAFDFCPWCGADIRKEK